MNMYTFKVKRNLTGESFSGKIEENTEAQAISELLEMYAVALGCKKTALNIDIKRD